MSREIFLPSGLTAKQERAKNALTDFGRHIAAGADLIAKGDKEAGEAEYLRAAKACPEAWLGLAGADLKAGELKAAFDKCTQVVEFAGNDRTKSAGLNNVGMILTRWNRRAEALP